MNGMKRILSLILAVLILAGTSCAFAAPTRDRRALFAEEDDSLRGFLSTVMSAAYLKDVEALAPGEAPSQGLVEAVLAVYEYHMLGDDRAELTGEECADLYRSFFSSGSFAMPEKGDCPCVTVENGRLIIDLEELEETALCGAYVYESVMDGGYLDLKADLYTAWGYYLTPAGEIPDEDLVWIRGARIRLEAAEGTAFGWRLISFALGRAYTDGAMDQWTEYVNDGMGLSLNVPAGMTLTREAEDGAGWVSADGRAVMTLERLPGMSFAEGRDLMGQLEGYAVYQEEFDILMCIGAGTTWILVCSDAVEYAWRLVLDFPEDLAEEYGLYSEIIRNSFVVWGLSNG